MSLHWNVTDAISVWTEWPISVAAMSVPSDEDYARYDAQPRLYAHCTRWRTIQSIVRRWRVLEDQRAAFSGSKTSMKYRRLHNETVLLRTKYFIFNTGAHAWRLPPLTMLSVKLFELRDHLFPGNKVTASSRREAAAALIGFARVLCDMYERIPEQKRKYLLV